MTQSQNKHQEPRSYLSFLHVWSRSLCSHCAWGGQQREGPVPPDWRFSVCSTHHSGPQTHLLNRQATTQRFFLIMSVELKVAEGNIALLLCLCIYVYLIICIYRYIQDYKGNSQTTMEDTDGGLHPAVDGQSLDKDEEYTGMCIWAHAFVCMYTYRCMSMAKLVIWVWAILLICYIFWTCVSVCIYLCRPAYVYEYDCFVYVHTCAYNMFVCTLWLCTALWGYCYCQTGLYKLDLLLLSLL